LKKWSGDVTVSTPHPLDFSVVVAIRQGVEECYDVADVSLAERRCVAGLSIKRRRPIEIAPIHLGQVIEPQYAVRRGRIPVLRPGIAFGVKSHRIRQAVHDAIVEEHPANRHVAQRRGAKQAAILRPVREVAPPGSAQSEVVVSRLGIRRDAGVARGADGRIAEVSECRKRAATHRARMTAGAIAPGRIVEGGQTPGFLTRELGLLPQPRIVLAGVRIKLSRILLVRLQRQQHSAERERGVAENAGAEGVLKACRIAGMLDFGHHRQDARIGHFERR